MDEIEQAIAELQNLIDAYHFIEGSFVPQNIREALEKNWDQIIDCVEPLALGEYANEHRTKDRSRVIPMRSAIALMEDYEADLVDKTVLDFMDLLWRNLSSQAQRIAWLAANAWSIDYKLIWDVLKAVFYARAIVRKMLLYTLEIMAVVEVIKMMKGHAQLRDSWIEKARKRALPQSTGRRYRRRKVAR